MIQASRHYALLDYARGSAALGVVFHHRGVHPKFPAPLNWYSEYGLLGVSIFFVISGFVIYQASERYEEGGAKGPLRFAWKRIKRIYPAYWGKPGALPAGGLFAPDELRPHPGGNIPLEPFPAPLRHR